MPCACLLLQLFITTTGVFMSSWLGGTLLSIGEFIIKRLPLVKHIYSASKQVRRCQTPHISSQERLCAKCCAAHIIAFNLPLQQIHVLSSKR
jgi:uncharacterized membrane protein